MTGDKAGPTGPAAPRFIVASRLREDMETEWSVVDTQLHSDDAGEVLFTQPSRGIASRVCEALNFHHDLAASPRDPSLHEARIEIDWHPSASVGEADAVKRLLESVCEGAMETLLEWGVVDPTISLSVDGAGVPKDVS